VTYCLKWSVYQVAPRNIIVDVVSFSNTYRILYVKKAVDTHANVVVVQGHKVGLGPTLGTDLFELQDPFQPARRAGRSGHPDQVPLGLQRAHVLFPELDGSLGGDVGLTRVVGLVEEEDVFGRLGPVGLGFVKGGDGVLGTPHHGHVFDTEVGPAIGRQSGLVSRELFDYDRPAAFDSRLLASLVMPIIHETDGTSDKVSDIIDRTGCRLQRATIHTTISFPSSRRIFPFGQTIPTPNAGTRLTQSPLGQHNPSLLPAFNHPPDPAAPVVGAAAVAEG
jgi:hypothetical protein